MAAVRDKEKMKTEDKTTALVKPESSGLRKVEFSLSDSLGIPSEHIKVTVNRVSVTDLREDYRGFILGPGPDDMYEKNKRGTYLIMNLNGHVEALYTWDNLTNGWETGGIVRGDALAFRFMGYVPTRNDTPQGDKRKAKQVNIEQARITPELYEKLPAETRALWDVAMTMDLTRFI